MNFLKFENIYIVAQLVKQIFQDQKRFLRDAEL